MVCSNCRENNERIAEGYNAHDLDCTCSKSEKTKSFFKLILTGLLLFPLVGTVVLLMTPVFLVNRLGAWLEN